MPNDRELLQQALPCPFCGSDKVSVEEGSTFRWVFACCDNCDAKAGEVRKQTTGAGNPQEWHEKAEVRAIEEWNKRARLAQPELRITEDMWKKLSELQQKVMEIAHTAPSKKKWVGLTDDELTEMRSKVQKYTPMDSVEYGLTIQCAMEEKLREKNGMD